MDRPEEPRLLEARLAELRAKRNQLADYVAAMRRVADGGGSTVHDLIWRERRLSQRLGDLAGQAARLSAWTGRASDRSWRPSSARSWPSSPRSWPRRRALASGGGANPWRFLATAELQPFEVPDLIELVRDLGGVLEEVRGGLARHAKAFADVGETSLSAVAERIRGLLALPAAGAEVRCDLLGTFARPEARAAFDRAAAARAALDCGGRHLAGCVPAGPLAVAGRLPLAPSVGAGARRGRADRARARRRARSARAAAERVDLLVANVASPARDLGLPAALPRWALEAMAVGIELVAAASGPVLAARRPGLAAAAGTLRAAEESARALKEERGMLSRALDLDAVPWAELDALVAALDRQGMVAGLLPAVRTAEARIRPLLRGRVDGLGRADIAGLLRRAKAWRDRRHELAADPSLCKLLGPGWGGIDADFPLLLTTAQWMAGVDRRFGADPEAAARPCGPSRSGPPGACSSWRATRRWPGRSATSPGPRTRPKRRRASCRTAWRARPDVVEKLADAAASIGLSPDYPLARLPALAEAIVDAGGAEAGCALRGSPQASTSRPRWTWRATSRRPGCRERCSRRSFPLPTSACVPGCARRHSPSAAKVEIVEDYLSRLAERFRADWSAVLGVADVRDAPLASLHSRHEPPPHGPTSSISGPGSSGSGGAWRRSASGRPPPCSRGGPRRPAAVPDVVELARVRGLLRAAFRATPALADLDGLQLGQGPGALRASSTAS